MVEEIPSNDSPQKILVAFEKFAGAEQFRKFVRALDWEPRSKRRTESPGLFFWQEDLWNAFRGDCTSYDVPSEYSDIVALFAHAPRPQPCRLNRWEVPEWCDIEEVHNGSPLQVLGKCFERAWYFRARGSGWSLELAQVPGLDIDDLFGSEVVHRIQGTYGERPYSDPVMTEEEGMYLIATGLKKLLPKLGITVGEQTD